MTIKVIGKRKNKICLNMNKLCSGVIFCANKTRTDA